MSSRIVVFTRTLVSCICLVGILLCLQLKVSDNALDLLPDEAVDGSISHLLEMGLVNRIFITLTLKEDSKLGDIEGRNALKKSVAELGDRLAADGRFTFVLSHLDSGFQKELHHYISTSLPYLLEASDYQTIRKKITREAIESELQSLYGLLNSPAGFAVKRTITKDPLGFSFLGLKKLQNLRSEFQMGIDDGFFFSQDGRSCLLLAESTLSLTDSANAAEISQFLETTYSEVLAQDVRAIVIGTLPHTLANAETVKKDLQILLPVATILLGCFLGLMLRDIKVFLVMAVPFLAALPAIGVTNLVYGQLSGIALGFGIVLLGIGVDFAIHLYHSLNSSGITIKKRVARVTRPIVFATLTTSMVFVILHFSSVASHRQMATLALVGILLAVLFSYLLIPALFSESLTEQEETAIVPEETAISVPDKRYNNRWAVLLFWLIIVIGGIYCWPQMQYNGDLRVLDVPTEDVTRAEQFFNQTWGDKGEQLFIITKGSLEEVLENNSHIYEQLGLAQFKNFQSFATLLPGKLRQQQNKERWISFWQEHRKNFVDDFITVSTELGFSKDAFVPFLLAQKEPGEEISPPKVIDGPLAPLFRSMLKNSTPIAIGEVESREDDSYLSLTTIDKNSGDKEQLFQSLDGTPGIVIIDNVQWRTEVEDLLRADVESLSLLAGVAICVIVALQFRSFTIILAVLAPVLSALSAMSIFCYFTGRELNMMHLIMGIMVMGLSVDYGIFTVCSLKNKKNWQKVNSGRAVHICAVSSLLGFGVLAFAQHPALHSLGITVLVGIGVAWPTAIWVSPYILSRNGNKSDEAATAAL